ncbi:MAG: hypothetical protein NZL85_09155 [Fimbriimonadales bacterium]|nr:hypothetical protein [Fimbriimonadales bacterium]
MKPIPENRRWQEERAKHPDGLPPSPEAVSVMVVVTEPSVVIARYTGTCLACRQAIQPGMPITRHAHLHRWVHEQCRDAQVDSLAFPARYRGFCRACHRPIQVGDMIARDADWGWVHQECLRNHLVHIAHHATLAEIDEIIERLLNEGWLNDWEEDDVG